MKLCEKRVSSIVFQIHRSTIEMAVYGLALIIAISVFMAVIAVFAKFITNLSDEEEWESFNLTFVNSIFYKNAEIKWNIFILNVN